MKSFKFIGGSLQGQTLKARGNEIYIKFNDGAEFAETEYYMPTTIGNHEVYLLSELKGCEFNRRPYLKDAGLL